MTIGSTPHSIPHADALYERAVRLLPGGNSRTTVFVPPHPPYAARGEGATVVDLDGHRLLDLQNNYTSLIHGHAFPPVVEAATAALSRGASFGLPTPGEVELAELLAQRMPWAPQWRFANSGTEAVMIAIRAARAFTGRDGLVRFTNCYHGTYDAVSAEGSRGVPAAAHQDVASLPVNDAAALRSALDAATTPPAAVLLDIMPNRAGLPQPDPGFLGTVARETKRRGIVLIVDEVITFRLAQGGLQQRYGIEADLVTVGKLIGGGLPVGAIGGSPEVMAVFDPTRPNAVSHGGTFSANPVTMAAGLAALRAYDSVAIERINGLGEMLRAQLAGAGVPVTGQGSLLRLHTDQPAVVWWRLYERGVLIAANGLICLSTPMTERDVQSAAKEIIDVMADPAGAHQAAEAHD